MIQFPRYDIDIQITYAQVAARTTDAVVDFQMEPSPAERMLNPIEWRTVPREAHIEINTDEFRREFDIELPVDWSEKLAAESRMELEEGNRWRANNGDLYYRATPGDTRPLLDYAMRYFTVQDARYESANVALAPNAKPQIIPRVDPSQNYVVDPLSTAINTYRFQITPHSVEVYLAVQPDIQMRAVPKLDVRV